MVRKIDEADGPNTLRVMMEEYERRGADYLMLLARRDEAVGYTGQGDFDMDEEGHLVWRKEGEVAPFMFAGVQIMLPSHFARMKEDAFSNKKVWEDELIPEGRFIGHVMDGRWLRASSAEDVVAIEKAFNDWGL